MKPNTLPARYGIYIIAVWSAVLGLLNLIRVVYTLSDTVITDAGGVWLNLFVYRGAHLLFGILFLVAAAGLWLHRNWGRRLFLVCIVFFFGVSLNGLFTPSAQTLPARQKWWLGGRYLLSIVLAVAYLNLPAVARRFQPVAEETTTDD